MKTVYPGSMCKPSELVTLSITYVILVLRVKIVREIRVVWSESLASSAAVRGLSILAMSVLSDWCDLDPRIPRGDLRRQLLLNPNILNLCETTLEPTVIREIRTMSPHGHGSRCRCVGGFVLLVGFGPRQTSLSRKI